MKFNLEQQLVGLDGEPTTQTTVNGYNSDGSPKEIVEVPLTISVVLRAAFNTTKKDSPLSVEDAVKRGKWIMAINKKQSPDFKVEEQAEIKKLCIDAGFTPIIIAQIDELIEGKGKAKAE